MRSLQAKIVLVYFALAMVIVGLSVVALIELDRIADRAREGSKVAELFDATLEMRRFEKNHLLYGQARDLEDHARFAALARELLARDAGALDALAGAGTAAGLSDDLSRYTEAMAAHARAPFDETLSSRIRLLGNRIVTVGERLSALERQSMNVALAAHQRTLLIWLVVVAAVLALTGVVLARQVTRPLKVMEERMGAVASGALTRLTPDRPEREFVSLAEAFNHVLDELERRQHTLVRSEKLVSLGTLLSGVAHELNNPLSNISTSAQILNEDPHADPEFRRQLLADIDRESQRAAKIVRSLLDYARERSFERRPVNLAELVDETLRFLKTQRAPGIELKVDVPAELTIAADRPRLQQALLNLIKNALEAMGDYGELAIAARRSSERDDSFPVFAGNCRAGEAAVDLTIADTGPGIPPEVLPRIFDPFFTTKPVGHGSGLGLFIVHEIIDEHGGCIGVENRPEGGTRFHIRLPLGEPSSEKP